MQLQGQLPDDSYSIAALLDPLLDHDIANASGDNVKSSKAKSCILMEYAGKIELERIASETFILYLSSYVLNGGTFSDPAGSDEWWKRFESCDHAVIRFMQTLPPVQLARDVEELAYIILIHSKSSHILLKCIQELTAHH
jgi:hypothetical protein